MTAFLAAVMRVPMTAFITIMEMVGGHAMVLSVMASHAGRRPGVELDQPSAERAAFTALHCSRGAPGANPVRVPASAAEVHASAQPPRQAQHGLLQRDEHRHDG